MQQQAAAADLYNPAPNPARATAAVLHPPSSTPAGLQPQLPFTATHLTPAQQQLLMQQQQQLLQQQLHFRLLQQQAAAGAAAQQPAATQLKQGHKQQQQLQQQQEADEEFAGPTLASTRTKRKRKPTKWSLDYVTLTKGDYGMVWMASSWLHSSHCISCALTGCNTQIACC
jgi:hypothetical protein